jgi:hypothetical protein
LTNEGFEAFNFAGWHFPLWLRFLGVPPVGTGADPPCRI